jgi:hypothetical protein
MGLFSSLSSTFRFIVRCTHAHAKEIPFVPLGCIRLELANIKEEVFVGARRREKKTTALCVFPGVLLFPRWLNDADTRAVDHPQP